MVVLFGVLEMLDLLLGHDFFLLHYVLQQFDGAFRSEVHVDSLFYAFGWGFLDSYLLVLILELSMTLRKKITLGQVWNINSFISYNCQFVWYFRETKMYLRDPMFEVMNVRDIVAFVESVFILGMPL